MDATLGEGGHADAVLRAAVPGGQLLGIDADPEAISVARSRLSGHAESFLAVNENFRDLRAIALQRDFVPVHGVLFDLGVSSLQLDAETRGFSFRRQRPARHAVQPAPDHDRSGHSQPLQRVRVGGLDLLPG